ncbi:TorF family putative porin [Thalassotalea fusca]
MHHSFKWLPTLFVSFALFSTQCRADLSVTVTAASDYLFNGVSQTKESTALQGSIDWSNDRGWYAGSWASNVDFGDDTDAEVDYYAGFTQEINNSLFYDVGLAHYTYVGGSGSSDINYTEIYFAIGYQSTQIKAWYTNDYAGTDAGHYIVALSHSIEMNEQLTLTFQIDRSASLNDDKFVWDTNDDSYIHGKVEAAFTWQDLAFTLSVEKTDLDYDRDMKLLGTVSYTFGF